MRILGLDCSTSSTGWSVFDDKKLIAHGCIKPVGNTWQSKLGDLARHLFRILKEYRPDEIISEDVPLKRGNVQVLVVLGAVKGMILTIASAQHIPIRFVMPSAWRSPLNIYHGDKKGSERDELKHKSIMLANQLFNLNLVYKSPSSKFNEDDEAEAILIGAYGAGYCLVNSKRRE